MGQRRLKNLENSLYGRNRQGKAQQTIKSTGHVV